MTITADRFLEGLKRRVTVPASQVLMLDADLLAIADDIIRAYLIPLFVSVRQDFFVTSTETQLEDQVSAYDIPYRAIARGLRDLKIVDSSGSVRDVALIPIEEVHRFGSTTLLDGFYFKGDQIVLVTEPSNPATGEAIQFWWEEPPGRLVTVSEAAKVVSISTNVVTVTSIPSTITAGVTVDFLKGTSGNRTLDRDIGVTAATGTQITFALGDVPSSLAANDYISLAETSPVIQLPNEAYSLLESQVARRILIANGDFDGAKMLDEDIRNEDRNLKMILEPRIQGEPQVIINRTGLLRGRRYTARRGLMS